MKNSDFVTNKKSAAPIMELPILMHLHVAFILYVYVFLFFFLAAGNKTLFRIRRYPGELG